MAIYDIEVTHLIDMLFDILINEKRVQVKVLGYAVDFTAASVLEDLRISWNVSKEIGPKLRILL